MSEALKQIESAAINLAYYIREHGNSIDISVVIAQAALISERAKDLISKNEIAGVSVLPR